MNATFTFTLTMIAALGCGLMAGTFFAFSAFVMAALGRLPPEQGVAAMQSIDITVLNPVFFAAFFGTAILCVALAAVALLWWQGDGSLYLIVGSVLYLAGCILVTMLRNVPLNNRLAGLAPESAEAATFWAHYLSHWTAWNHVRTVAPLAALALFIMALRTLP